MKHSYYCDFCYIDIEEDDMIICDNCGKTFCKECLKEQRVKRFTCVFCEEDEDSPYWYN